jgi:hypothetical protein
MGILSRVKTWAAGETLTASDLNAEFDNILNNLDPDNVEDASANATAMQAVADPYPGASESLATDLRGEIQRIRYQLKAILGEAQWYIDPDNTIAGLHTAIPSTATTSAEGLVELATNAEFLTMTDTTRAVTCDAVAQVAQFGNIWIPALSFTPRTTNGASYGSYEYATNDKNFSYYAFDDATAEYVDFNMALPEIWDLTNLKVRYFWGNASGASASDQVSFKIEVMGFGNDDAIDAAYSTSDTCDDVVIADGDLHICTETSEITVDGFAAGDLCQFSISRNVAGNDNMEEDLWLFGVLMQYGIGTAIAEWS